MISEYLHHFVKHSVVVIIVFIPHFTFETQVCTTLNKTFTMDSIESCMSGDGVYSVNIYNVIFCGKLS